MDELQIRVSGGKVCKMVTDRMWEVREKSHKLLQVFHNIRGNNGKNGWAGGEEESKRL